MKNVLPSIVLLFSVLGPAIGNPETPGIRLRLAESPTYAESRYVPVYAALLVDHTTFDGGRMWGYQGATAIHLIISTRPTSCATVGEFDQAAWQKRVITPSPQYPRLVAPSDFVVDISFFELFDSRNDGHGLLMPALDRLGKDPRNVGRVEIKGVKTTVTSAERPEHPFIKDWAFGKVIVSPYEERKVDFDCSASGSCIVPSVVFEDKGDGLKASINVAARRKIDLAGKVNVERCAPVLRALRK